MGKGTYLSTRACNTPHEASRPRYCKLPLQNALGASSNLLSTLLAEAPVHMIAMSLHSDVDMFSKILWQLGSSLLSKVVYSKNAIIPFAFQDYNQYTSLSKREIVMDGCAYDNTAL